MQRMLPTARAEFLELNPVGVVPPILLSRVVPLFAIRAGQGDHRPDIFTLFSHFL